MLVCDTVARMRSALVEHAIDCGVLGLPDSGPDAFDTLAAALATGSDVPVIALARSDEPSLALRAIDQGAQDYLPEHAADPDALRRSIHYAIARKRTETSLARQALHDALTDLPNRALLLDRLNVAVGRSRRRPNSLALLFLDLDGFKRVNDRLGHEAGDDLLVEVARRLQRVLRPGDTVARYGGDEFVILCEDLSGQREAMRVAERAQSTIAEAFKLRGKEVAVQASVGIARARRGHTDAHDLIRKADIAMYRAKRRGGGIELFETATTMEAMSELEIEYELRGAVERDEFRLHFQPIVGLGAHDTPLALEALVRWGHSERGLLLPAEFLPLAEETGLIIQIDHWVLLEACRQLAHWREDELVGARLPVSVNVSSRSLSSPAFTEAIEHAIAATQMPSACLSVEVTETSVDRDPARTADVLAALDRLGVRLVLDDFGTGRSSLGTLSTTPFDVVKLDPTATASATADPATARILGAVVGVARAAERQTVAEGIETPSQLDAMRTLGCDAGQGFLFAAPAPAEQMSAWLASRKG